ncbi:hypothetical protein BO78DRAFT_383958 [Aspergillus sclerotiicarbonarius CBS 121057]|uniref:FAD/NAD(P)-binding domain-containing protein n=1 Tax=Aspergillus sclerotiicarbonarius (strain CBS 121057 / IBT 28362) TaxID=1448318 RepID=A0A319F2Y4_ASPSB|nr:hypothetical protein BO78DRAFT_383958 [Aspergillus sclerotiicarbonarius CBS 121057]
MEKAGFKGSLIHLTEDHVILNGEREQKYDFIILATGFSNPVESIRQIFGKEIAGQSKLLWGMDKEGELHGAWKLSGVDNLWFMVGALQHSRYHSKKPGTTYQSRDRGYCSEAVLGVIRALHFMISSPSEELNFWNLKPSVQLPRQNPCHDRHDTTGHEKGKSGDKQQPCNLEWQLGFR